MAELRVCSLAESEFADALCWYAQRSEAVANRFDGEFSQALQTIASDPERYPRVDGRHRFFLMRTFPYEIIFRDAVNLITVIAVAHTARPPNYWVGR